MSLLVILVDQLHAHSIFPMSTHSSYPAATGVDIVLSGE